MLEIKFYELSGYQLNTSIGVRGIDFTVDNKQILIQ